MMSSRGRLMNLTVATWILWNHRGLTTNFSGKKRNTARILNGGWYANTASALTPSRVKTARRNCISATALAEILLKVFDNIDTSIVRKRVLPRKANATIRLGPRNLWNSDYKCISSGVSKLRTAIWLTARSIPVPSRPNQIQSIHLAIVRGECLL